MPRNTKENPKAMSRNLRSSFTRQDAVQKSEGNNLQLPTLSALAALPAARGAAGGAGQRAGAGAGGAVKTDMLRLPTLEALAGGNRTPAADATKNLQIPTSSAAETGPYTARRAAGAPGALPLPRLEAVKADPAESRQRGSYDTEERSRQLRLSAAMEAQRDARQRGSYAPGTGEELRQRIDKLRGEIALSEGRKGGNGFSASDAAKYAGISLLNGVASLAAAGAWAEDLVGGVLDTVFKDAGFKGSGVFNTLYNGDTALARALGLTGIKEYTEQINQAAAENAAKIKTGNAKWDRALQTAATLGNELSFGVGAALPMAVTAGASSAAEAGGLAAAGADGLIAQGARVVENSGLLSRLGEAGRKLLTSKDYWTSFAQEVGQDYYEALQDGATEDQANRYAIATALLSSVIEIGGGIQNTASPLWKSSLEEGVEEIEQGPIQRLMKQVVYGKEAPLFSSTDEDAVINPVTAAKEFAMGGAVGGVLGGGQRLAGQIITRAGERATATQEGSTAVNDDPAEHTPAEQAEIEAYKAAVDKRLLGWMHRVKTAMAGGDHTAQKMRLVLGAVTDNTARAVMNATGIDVSGFSHMIDGSAVWHGVKRHGSEGAHDRTMSNEADLARIGYVLDHFDRCQLLRDGKGNTITSRQYRDKNNRPAPMVQISKSVDGEYYVVEAVPDSKDKKLHIVSAYMKKRNGSFTQELNMENGISPQLTSKAQLGPVASAVPTIPQTVPGVNTRGMTTLQLLQQGRKEQGLPYIRDLDEDGTLAYRQATESMTAARQAEFDRARDVARRFGAILEVAERDGAEGSYQNGRITISPTAQNPVRSVLIHELTHHMETGGLYQTFADKVLTYARDSLGIDERAMLEEIKADYARGGQLLTDEGARRELVAKFAQDRLFTDEATVQRLLAEDRSLFQRIYDWIRDTAAKLRGSSEQRFLIDAQNLYEKALRQATGASTQGEEYLINPHHVGNLRNWQEDGRPGGETFILGSTGPVLQGLGAMENDIYMQSDKINTILREHPEMTLEEIERLPEIAEDPVLVLKSKTRPNSIIVIGVYNAQNGRPVLAALDLQPMENRILLGGLQKLSSAYTKTESKRASAAEVGRHFLETSEVLYLDKKRAAPVLLRMGILAPMDILRNGSIGSITYENAAVKIDGVPFSSVVHTNAPQSMLLTQGYAGQLATGRSFEELTAAQRGYSQEAYLDRLAQDENVPGRRGARPGAEQAASLSRAEAPNDYVGMRVPDPETAAPARVTEPPAAVKLERERIPRKAEEYLQRAENQLTADVARAMEVPVGASREYLKPIVRDMTDEYLQQGTVGQETRERLFDEAWQHGVLEDDTLWQETAEIRRTLRETGVTLEEAGRSDAGDYELLRKRAFGKVKILDHGGTPVDEVYAHLTDADASLFPADITNPADQLQRMVDVAESLGKVERKLSALRGQEADFYRTQAKRDFDAAIDGMTSELQRVKRYSEDQLRRDAQKLDDPQLVKVAYSQIKELRRKRDAAVGRNLLTEADRAKVSRLLRGEIRPDALDPTTDNVKGILDVFDASEEYEYAAKVIRQYNKQRKAALLEDADSLLQHASEWKDKRTGFAYQRETMERNIRDITGRSAAGEALISHYITPVHANEAEATRMKNKLRDRVRGMKLSREVDRGNEVSEAYAVQLVGEAENAMEMLREAPRGTTREGRTYEDWKALVDDLWENNPALDQKKIRDAVDEFRDIYDGLFQQLNEVHLRNGYEPISYRKGYFPHFQANEPDGILAAFGKALGVTWEVTPLPTSINGLTGMFKPGKRWMAAALERRGYDTVYDAVEGFDRYLETAADVIHHTDDIQRLRALAQQIRYRTTDEGIRKQIDDVRSNTDLSEVQKQDELNRIHENGRFTLNNFVLNLEEYTNLLAGKKSKHDRHKEERFGDRRWYNLIQALESRVAANMVGVNPGSWLTNFIPLTQTWGAVDTKNLLKAMGRTLGSTVGGQYSDGVAEMSDFLTNRRGSERLAQTKVQQLSAAAGKGMEIIDNFTSEVVVRARYLQNLERGMSEAAAMLDADGFAASLMADRSKGSMPTLFHEKNPITKLLTQYQLEVNNQLSWLFKDLPAGLKDRGAAALAAALLKFFVGSWLYNELYEKLVGRRPALDPIGMLNDFSGDITGWEMPNLVDLVTGADREFRTEKRGAYDAVSSLAKNAAEELPFVGGLLGGGRIPISSALPNVQNIGKAALNDDWSAEKRRAAIAKELSMPAVYLIPPFGGGQLKKIYQGIKAVVQAGSYSIDKDGNQLLQYPVYNDTPAQTAGNVAQAVLFGKTALPAAQDWIDSGFKSYSVKETAAYQGMLEAGVSGRDAIELLQQLRSTTKSDEESAAAAKRSLLKNAGISGEGKATVYYALMANEKEQAVMDELADQADAGSLVETLIAVRNAEKDTEKFRALQSCGLEEGQQARVFMELMSSDEDVKKLNRLQEDFGIDERGYYRFRDAIQGLSTKDEKLAAIDPLDLSIAQKDALYYLLGYGASTIDEAPWYDPTFTVAPKEPSVSDGRAAWEKNLDKAYGANSSSAPSFSEYLAGLRGGSAATSAPAVQTSARSGSAAAGGKPTFLEWLAMQPGSKSETAQNTAQEKPTFAEFLAGMK